MRRVELRVKANAERGCLVTNLEALDAGLRRFIGWEYDAGSSSWKPKPDPELLVPANADHLSDYLKSLRLGELLSADDDTRLAAGLPAAPRPIVVAAEPAPATKTQKIKEEQK